MTLQDFVKGVDFTGLVSASGADHNNLIELAAPYIDGGGAAGDGKGLVLVTSDTALGVPVVPDPTIGGFQKWIRYLWLRIPHFSSTNKNPIIYGWNGAAGVDPTLKRWLPVTYDPSAIIALIDALKGVGWVGTETVHAVAITANTALDTANNAFSLANTANTNALLALNLALHRLIDNGFRLSDTVGGSWSQGPLGFSYPLFTYSYIKCRDVGGDGAFAYNHIIPVHDLFDAVANLPPFSHVFKNNSVTVFCTNNPITVRSGLAGAIQVLDKTKWNHFTIYFY